MPGRARRGRRLPIFGLYRPATGALGATVQFRPKGGKRWRAVATKTTNGSGFLVARPRATRSGSFRIAFRVGDGAVYTRAAAVRVTR